VAERSVVSIETARSKAFFRRGIICPGGSWASRKELRENSSAEKMGPGTGGSGFSEVGHEKLLKAYLRRGRSWE